ncbi:uncharacterized protein LOC110489407 isoform X1 [Oncorhynchus mykiss]|uniref:uncharacterized protein LOC110489407 isoform X1 n=1 Tax=Oncorhynchus mykiss TaxID=8022 RepID=UPI0018780C66|nr:uncharacterized protein LOC110489407 isoform X1 [Oncorhynchus mykiss]
MGLLKGRDGDGFPQYQEKFIRDCIRKFPCCEAALLQQQVMSIATVEIGNDQTAFSVLTQALMGKMTFIDADFCTTCGERGAEKRCSLCNMVGKPPPNSDTEARGFSHLFPSLLLWLHLMISAMNTPCLYANKCFILLLQVTYCGLICQRLHCPTHKICRGLQEKDTPRLREHCDEESDMVKETASFLAELRF